MRLRWLTVAGLFACLATCGLLALKWRQAERHARDTERWTRFVMDSLATTVHFPGPPPQPGGRDSVYWQWVATTAQLQSRRWQSAVQHWVRSRGTLLDEADVELLRRGGLADPPAQLRDSLMAHPELIPNPPVLGGTMSFNDVVLLRPSFAFAEFEDGHIGGVMLLRYHVEGGRVSWTRLWSTLE